MFTQNVDPTGSLTTSALLALLPLAAILVLLGVFKWKAHWAGLTALAIGLIVAIAAYDMPTGQAFNAAGYGATLSVLLILWITFNAIWIYNLTVHTGHFAVLRRTFFALSDDRRIQAVIIAFSFGALIEALAGGGSPIAICSVMLIALGFDPIKAATMALIGNTAPVAFGGMGNPMTVLGATTGLSADDFGAMAGRQTSILAVIVPFILIGIADGRRGLREAWPAALTAGLSFGVTQFLLSSYFTYKLCDIFGALVSAGAVIALSKVWSPARGVSMAAPPPAIAGGASDDPAFVRTIGPPEGDSRADQIRAILPYAIVVLLFSLAQVDSIKTELAKGTHIFTWPGLHIAGPGGKPIATLYTFNYLSATGTLLFISGLLTLIALRISPVAGALVYGRTIRQFGWAILTIFAVFALSYVMNLSGQISTLGVWLSRAGGAFALLSPVVGWFGVTITGTDAGANALFGNLQVTAATHLHANPVLFASAGSSGGVMAKMISPQNLAIGTAGVRQVGMEGVLFRKVFGWSVLFLLAVCVLAYLQSTPVLGWMRVGG